MKLKQKKGNPNKSPNTEYPAGSRCDGLPLDAEQSECLVSLLLSLPPPGFHSTRDGTFIFITDHHFLFFNHDNQTSIWSLNVVFVSWLLVKASKMKREFHFVFAFFECQCSTDIIWCPTGAVKPLKQDIPHLFSSSGIFKQNQEYSSVIT